MRLDTVNQHVISVALSERSITGRGNLAPVSVLGCSCVATLADVPVDA